MLQHSSPHLITTLLLFLESDQTPSQLEMADISPCVPSSTFLAFLLLLLFIGFHPEPCNAARVLLKEPTSTSTDFIRASCRSTTYPSLCYNSLSTYASTIQNSPMQLAHTALSVSLDRALSASTDMKRKSATTGSGGMTHQEAAAMIDCMQNVGDSVDELRRSLGAMGHLQRGKDMGFQLNSIQTWVSSALTDDTTCMSGLEGGGAMNGNMRSAVRGRIVNVAQLTSNALALINGLASSPSHASSSP